MSSEEKAGRKIEIVIATTNKGKLAELRQMLAGYPVNIRGLDEFDAPQDFKETGKTFAENARLKAIHYAEILDRWVLADDSGLEVDALNGEPGVFSARFAGQTGPHSDQANNQKLIKLLADVPAAKRTARFRCCLCLSSRDKILIEVEGSVEGVIAKEPQGDNGFGYDPLFYLPNKGKTVAQLPPEEKNAISHRGQALKKLLSSLESLLKKPAKTED